MSTAALPSARAVDAVADAFVVEYAAADPVAATELGLAPLTDVRERR